MDTRKSGNTRNTGAQAEKLARQFLEDQGLETLQTNYACRYGELDVIMLDQNTIVFVEVRYRAGTKCSQSGQPSSNTQPYGDGAISVDRRKQSKLIKSAKHFLQHHHWLDRPSRIDIIALSALDNSAGNISWIQNAVEDDD